VLAGAHATADTFNTLANASCIHCHDGSEDNRLNLNELGSDLNDAQTFRMWERIHDRIAAGEMPPAQEPRPDRKTLRRSLGEISDDLTRVSRQTQRNNGRTVLRRLTRAELQHTLNDLLLTHLDLNEILPPENGSSDFDTVASEQGLSPLHVRAYIDAADAAIEAAIKAGPKPESEIRVHHFKEVKSTRNHLDKKNKNQDRVILLELDDSVVMFHTASYLFQLDDFHVNETGIYRIKATAASYQSDRPVISPSTLVTTTKAIRNRSVFLICNPNSPNRKLEIQKPSGKILTRITMSNPPRTVNALNWRIGLVNFRRSKLKRCCGVGTMCFPARWTCAFSPMEKRSGTFLPKITPAAASR
jgi:hypothetical protein